MALVRLAYRIGMFGWLIDAYTLSGGCDVRLYGSWSKQFADQRLRKVWVTYFQLDQLKSNRNFVSDAQIEGTRSSADQVQI
jgi:hypothetical protein